MAWAHFVEAGWEVHSGHGQEALRKYDEAELRFKAEGLLDGVVSVETARLAAYRLTGSIVEYAGGPRGGDGGQPRRHSWGDVLHPGE